MRYLKECFVNECLVLFIVQWQVSKQIRRYVTSLSGISSHDELLYTVVLAEKNLLALLMRYVANKLPPTLRIPYQFDPSSSSSSSLSSCSDPGPLVDLSRDVLYSRLKTFLFSKSFPP